MATTLYQPPPRPWLPGRVVKTAVVVLVLAGAGGYLYHRQPGWLSRAANGLLGLFGYEMVTVEVMTTPTRTDVLLDGVRMTELPLQVRRDHAIHRVSAIAPGYETAEITFMADGDRQLILTLKLSGRH